MRVCLVLVCLSIGFWSNAQFSSPQYSLGYFGHNIIQPGLHIGLGFETHSKEKSRKKWIGKKEKTIVKSRTLNPQLNVYHHVLNETNLTVGSEYFFHRSKKGNTLNFTQGMGLGLFYMRTWNAGETFEVVDGVVSRLPGAGSNYFAPSISYLASFGIRPIGNVPIQVFAKPTVFFRMPFNSTAVISANAVLGLTFSLPNSKKS